jgi:hypothetical protein
MMTDTQEYIANLGMPEKVTLFKELYSELAGQGIEGDTELAHVNTFEASLLKSLGGSGTINEVTGLREYKGGGGSPPPAPAQQTVTQTSEFPTELKPFISDVLGEAKGEFGREKAEGYLPFPGPQLAAFTPEQEQAFTTGRQQFGAQGLAGTPLGQASTYYAPALAATALGTAEIGTQDIQRRMDPFLQNVVDIAKREATRDEEVAQQRRAAQAVGAGSFGGSRQAIVEAEANRNLQRQLSDIQAAGLSTAFQNAQRAAEAQRAREMTGGRQFAGLGESAFGRAKGDIGGLAGIGEAQQARSQQALDIARREFEEEKAFPSTALQRYGSVIRGFPLTPSQQIVTSAPPIPTPSLAQTMLGAAGTGVGLYGAFGGFKRAGGLVGLLGGGTPTNPLKPPYNLFSGPSSRVGVPQYQGGGPLGVNLGGGYASGAVGGANTPAPVTSPTAPTAMDLNMIMEELRRRGVRRSEGGLAGLTVSRNARRGNIRIPSLAALIEEDEQARIDRDRGFTGRGWKSSPQYDTDEFGAELIEDEFMPSPQEEIRFRGIDPEGKIPEALKNLLPFGDVTDALAALQTGHFTTTGVPTDEVQEAEFAVSEQFDPALGTIYEPGERLDDPEADPMGTRRARIRPADITEIITGKIADPTGVDPHAMGTDVSQVGPHLLPTDAAVGTDASIGPDDAYDALRKRWGVDLLPDVPDTEAYPESLRKAHDELLAAYKKKGYGFDKWLTLADYAARLGSTAPREGESLLSIAQRVAPPSIEKLQKIGESERESNLGYLKAKVDIEGIRHNLKTGKEKTLFDNAIKRLLAGAELTKAQAALIAAKIPDIKLPRKIGKADLPLAGSILNTSMRNAVQNSDAFRQYLSKNLKATDSGEQRTLIDRLSKNQGVQAQVAQGLEEYRATTLGTTRKLPTKEETQVEALRIIKGILDVDPTLEKSNMFFRQFQW